MIKVGDEITWMKDHWNNGWQWTKHKGIVLSIEKEYIPGGIGVWGYILKCKEEGVDKIFTELRPTLNFEPNQI
jgi:hypothetical protein